MSLARKVANNISEGEYLDGEIISDIKHEYINGEVFAMAGAREKHNLISGNCFFELSNKLRQKQSPCKTFTSDMKVRVSGANANYFYPDVMVVCDNDVKDDEYYKNSPLIIVEVLSKSTRRNDKSIKMFNYFNIHSLEEYVLIEQDLCEVQVFRKTEHWQATYYFLGDEITFESIGVTISVEDIYYQVENEDFIDFLKEQKQEQDSPAQ